MRDPGRGEGHISAGELSPLIAVARRYPCYRRFLMTKPSTIAVLCWHLIAPEHIRGSAYPTYGDGATRSAPHVLHHTFGTNLVRQGTDVILAAELMGHRRLDTTRRYSLPTSADRVRTTEEATDD